MQDADGQSVGEAGGEGQTQRGVPTVNPINMTSHDRT